MMVLNVLQGDNVKEDKLDEEKTYKEDEVNKIYNDVIINLEGRDTKMTDSLLANVQATQIIEDNHVIITTVTLEVQLQISSVSSGFISKMLNLNPDTSIDSILNLNIELTSLVDVLVTTNDEIPPSSVTTLPPPTIPLIQPMQQTPISTPTIALSTFLQNLPTFGSLFKFEDRVKSLKDNFLKFKQTKLFAEAVSLIPGFIDKRRDDEDEDDEPSAGSNRGSKRWKGRKEPESTSALNDKTSKSTGLSKEGSNSKTRLAGKSAQVEEQVYTVKIWKNLQIRSLK
nr:hypothetical protein [Tanacetum cinerariifolium]